MGCGLGPFPFPNVATSVEACDKKQQGKHGAWHTLLDSVQLCHCMLDWASSSHTSTQLLNFHYNYFLHTTFKLPFIPRLLPLMFSTKSFAKKGVADKIKKRKFYAYSFVEIVENPTLNLWKK
jgi:hypothetical protein